MLARLGPYLVLLAEAALFFRKVLFGHYAIPWDLRYYHLPQLSFVAKCLREGVLPLWNPYNYCGMPWYGKIDSQLFYPPTIAAIVLSNAFSAGRHLLYWLELQSIAHVSLGGIFTYWLLQRLRLGRAAGLIGATIFQCGAFFAAHVQHQGAVNVAVWMPLAWLAIVDVAEKPSRRGFVLLAFSLAMSILAGFPALTAVVVVSCIALALAFVVARRAKPSLAALLGLAGLCAGLLAAVQLLPAFELTRLSHASLRGQIGDGGGIPIPALLTLVLPNHFGIFQFPGNSPFPVDPTFLYLYCGVPALAFAAWALWRRKHPYTLVFLAVTVLTGLWMLGKYTPVWNYGVRLVPQAVRGALYVEYASAAFTLGVAVLAAMGAHALLASRPAAVKAAAVLVTAADLLLVSSGRPFNNTDMTVEPGLGYDHFDAYREVPARMRELVNRATPPWRVDTSGGSPQWNNGSTLFEVPVASGDDPFALLRMLRFRLLFANGNWWERAYEISDLASPLVDLANVRYVLASQPIAAEKLARAKFAAVATLPGPQYVYENPEVLPRFFLVNRIRRAGSPEAALAALGSPGFDPRREAIVEGEVTLPPPSAAAGSVRVIGYEPNRVTLETESPVPAYLVSSEAYYPGWRASVDGRQQPILPTNAAFRGLSVPAGRHLVTMRLSPPSLWYGAVISALAWATLIVALRPSAKKPAL